MLQKVLAVLIILALLITIFKDYIWRFVGIAILVILIRLAADFYWAWKDTRR